MMADYLQDFGESLSFKVDEINVGVLHDIISRPTHLMITLDDMDVVTDYLTSFEHIILRVNGKEHDFTPSEVLAALYAARKELCDGDDD